MKVLTMNNRRIRAAFAIAVLALVIAFAGIAITGAGIVIKIDLFDDGTLVAEREGINIIGGSNITVSGVDNPAQNRVDYTLDAIAEEGWAELARITAIGGETTLTFTSIPDVDLMQIHAQGIGVNVVTGLRVFFNNDTGSNYTSYQGTFHGYAGSANPSESGCRIGHGSAPITQTAQDSFSFTIVQPSATLPKNYQGSGFYGNRANSFACRWNETSNKITEIDFVFEDSRTFLADGIIILLGR
jgi:hypothetical protein